MLQAIARFFSSTCTTSNVTLGEGAIALTNETLAVWQSAHPKSLVACLNFSYRRSK